MLFALLFFFLPSFLLPFFHTISIYILHYPMLFNKLYVFAFLKLKILYLSLSIYSDYTSKTLSSIKPYPLLVCFWQTPIVIAHMLLIYSPVHITCNYHLFSCDSFFYSSFSSLLTSLSVLLSFLVSVQGPHQRFLLRELLRDYNRMERPVANDSQTLTVQFSFTLMQVMDVVCMALIVLL